VIYLESVYKSMIMMLLYRTFKGEAQSVFAEDPPTHHHAAQPVPAKVGNGQDLAFIAPIYT